MKVKIIFRKNLNMSPGKLAAQAVHAAVALKVTNNSLPVVVLGYNDKRFHELVKEHSAVTIKDAGYTEVSPGTMTCAAFYETIPANPPASQPIPAPKDPGK